MSKMYYVFAYAALITLLILTVPLYIKSIKIEKMIKIKKEKCFSDKNGKFFIRSMVRIKSKIPGTVIVSGSVGSDQINKGDVFCLFDRNDKVVDNNVVVEQISKLFFKKLDSVPAESENVLLVLRTHLNKVDALSYLKK